jgi:hypothetical protein
MAEIDLTRRFLLHYKDLVHRYESARTSTDLVQILAQSSGMNIFPFLLFQPSGELKNFDVLRYITYQQLDFLIKKNTSNPGLSEILLVNLQQSQKKQSDWKMPSVTSYKEDAAWFFNKYGEVPTSAEAIRKTLLSNKIVELAFFLNFKTLQPWTDVPLLLAFMRQKK